MMNYVRKLGITDQRIRYIEHVSVPFIMSDEKKMRERKKERKKKRERERERERER